ncbi:MAG: GntR family transcriptional regulator [Clostridia bacterium]|nr:GntR family transcriptional regulator [Clostridia bacterium]
MITQLVRSLPLHKQVQDAIIEMIRSKKLPDNRLKSEEELASILNVSRATIREALHQLRAKGVITKRHGKGNYVHLSALDTRFRVDVYNDFLDLIDNAGYKPSLSQTDWQTQLIKAPATSRLDLPGDTEVIAFQRIYYANDDPAIYVAVQIPKPYILNTPINKQIYSSLKAFVEEYCHRDIAHSIDWLKGTCNVDIATVFQIPTDTPMLAWDQVYFGLEDEKICFSEIFFNPRYMDLSVLVKM